MSETDPDSRLKLIELSNAGGIIIEQTSTLGDGIVGLGEEFSKDTIDFSRALGHISIHTEGLVAGSQFNGSMFPDPQAVTEKVAAALPEALHYDQHGRAELTFSPEKGEVAGYVGVKSISDLQGWGINSIVQAARLPGGRPDEFDGIRGNWYPEVTQTAEGRFGLSERFEPKAWIAEVSEAEMRKIQGHLETDKVTIIIQKDPETHLPTVRTIFPGENAPPFPARTQADAFIADTPFSGIEEGSFWSEHAFIIISRPQTRAE